MCLTQRPSLPSLRSFCWRKVACIVVLLGGSLLAPAIASAQYTQTNLIANSAAYHPQIVDPNFGDAWGVAIRPAGLGGHFWITNKNTGVSSEYVGDVNGVALHQDGLKTVTIPPPAGSPAGTLSQPTGVVFNQTSDFVITQNHANGAITNSSKFLFATNDGTIAAWTERNNGNGTFDRPPDALVTVDHSARGDNFFGLTSTNFASGNHLYAANFGTNPGIETFDSTFADVSSQYAFTNPFAAQGYAAFNVQDIGGSLFVAYARYDSPGTEQHGAGLGHLVQYDYSGNLVATWDDGGLLNAPWGMAIAPAGFGKYSGDLLVGNFGDIDTGLGSLVAFDPRTHQALGYVEDAAGRPLVIPGVWGLTFGNGASLGEANALYFAAGPNGEQDGLFGRIQAVPEAGSVAMMTMCLLGVGCVGLRRRKR